MEEEKKETMHKICEQVEELIGKISEEGIQADNVELLGELVDIHKDIANEKYWDVKKEGIKMRYREGSYGNEYGNYGRRGRDSRGRYTRGGRGNYRGEEMIEEMQEHFGRYSEGREEMNMGNYGAEPHVMKSLDYMLQSVVEFVEMLKEEADSEEEMKLIKKYTRKISEM